MQKEALLLASQFKNSVIEPELPIDHIDKEDTKKENVNLINDNSKTIVGINTIESNKEGLNSKNSFYSEVENQPKIANNNNSGPINYFNDSSISSSQDDKIEPLINISTNNIEVGAIKPISENKISQSNFGVSNNFLDVFEDQDVKRSFKKKKAFSDIYIRTRM